MDPKRAYEKCEITLTENETQFYTVSTGCSDTNNLFDPLPFLCPEKHHLLGKLLSKAQSTLNPE